MSGENEGMTVGADIAAALDMSSFKDVEVEGTTDSTAWDAIDDIKAGTRDVRSLPGSADGGEHDLAMGFDLPQAEQPEPEQGAAAPEQAEQPANEQVNEWQQKYEALEAERKSEQQRIEQWWQQFGPQAQQAIAYQQQHMAAQQQAQQAEEKQPGYDPEDIFSKVDYLLQRIEGQQSQPQGPGAEVQALMQWRHEQEFKGVVDSVEQKFAEYEGFDKVMPDVLNKFAGWQAAVPLEEVAKMVVLERGLTKRGSEEVAEAPRPSKSVPPQVRTGRDGRAAQSRGGLRTTIDSIRKARDPWSAVPGFN